MESGTLFEKPLRKEGRRLPLQWIISISLLLVALASFWWYLQRTPPAPRSAAGETAYVPPEGLLRAGDTDFEWYQPYFRILDTKGTIVFNFAGDRVIMISGVFENRGERAVEAAEIKLTFFDPEGKIIRRRIAAPLRRETGLRRSLKSLEKRSFSVRFENMPIDLQVGKLEVVLTGIKFAPRGE